MKTTRSLFLAITVLAILTCLNFEQAHANSGARLKCEAIFAQNSRQTNFQYLYGIDLLEQVKADPSASDQLFEKNQNFANFLAKKRAEVTSLTDSELAAAAKMKLEDNEFSPKSLNWFEASALYSHDVRSGVLADIAIAKVSDSVGFGVFARTKIEKGAMIGEYTGILRQKSADDTGNGYIFNTQYAGYVIDAKQAGNETRFINHSRGHANAVYLN